MDSLTVEFSTKKEDMFKRHSLNSESHILLLLVQSCWAHSFDDFMFSKGKNGLANWIVIYTAANCSYTKKLIKNCFALHSLLLLSFFCTNISPNCILLSHSWYQLYYITELFQINTKETVFVNKGKQNNNYSGRGKKLTTLLFRRNISQSQKLPVAINLTNDKWINSDSFSVTHIRSQANAKLFE